MKDTLIYKAASVWNNVSDCICCSAFIKGNRDYEENQRSHTLLKKCKTHIAIDNTTILYIKDGFTE